jgi:hypothetical protein
MDWSSHVPQELPEPLDERAAWSEDTRLRRCAPHAATTYRGNGRGSELAAHTDGLHQLSLPAAEFFDALVNAQLLDHARQRLCFEVCQQVLELRPIHTRRHRYRFELLLTLAGHQVTRLLELLTTKLLALRQVGKGHLGTDVTHGTGQTTLRPRRGHLEGTRPLPLDLLAGTGELSPQRRCHDVLEVLDQGPLSRVDRRRQEGIDLARRRTTLHGRGTRELPPKKLLEETLPRLHRARRLLRLLLKHLQHLLLVCAEAGSEGTGGRRTAASLEELRNLPRDWLLKTLEGFRNNLLRPRRLLAGRRLPPPE